MLRMWTFVLCFQLSLATVGAGAAEFASGTSNDGASAATQQQPPGKKGPQATRRPRPKRGQPQNAAKLPAAPQPKEEIAPPTGPMRVLFHSIVETRVRGKEDLRGGAKSSIRLTTTVTGERLGELVGVGSLVIEEMVDDTGKVLASPADVTDADRNDTKPVRVSARLMRRGHFERTREIRDITNRKASKLSKASGWVNLVYGHETEEVLIDNPTQYMGGLIDNQRLKEIGLKIEVVKPGDGVKPEEAQKGIGLRFVSGHKQIRRIELFDAWMRSVHPKDRLIKPKEGEPYTFYVFTLGKADADTQLLLTVYPSIEEEQVRFEFKDLELP